MRASRLLLAAALAATLPSWAWGACEVQYAPSKDVSDYLANAERAMAQVRLAAASSSCGFSGTGAAQGILSQPSQEIMSFGNEIGKSVNGVANFDTFKTTFQFYVGMPVLQPDAPEYLYRDNELLEKTQKKIDDLGKYVARRCANGAAVKPVKLKDGTSYPAAGATAKTVLGDLTATNGDVLNYFRGIAVGFESIDAKARLEDAAQRPLFPRKGTDGIYVAYGTDRDACRNGDGDFSRIVTAVTDVAQAFSDTGGATKYWMQAWKLMSGLASGGRDAEYEKAERELLKKELARQGISGRAADQILKNLDDANAQNMGLTGFMASIGDRVAGTFRDFGNQIQQQSQRFSEEAAKFQTGPDGASKPADQTTDGAAGGVDARIRAQGLALDLAKNHFAASLATKDSESTAQEATRILGNSHRDLQGALRRMEDTMKDATKLCNSQGSNIAETRAICNAKAPAK